MYSYDDRTVVVTNQHRHAVHGLVVKARVLDASRPTGELIRRVVTALEVPADGKVVALTLPPLDADVTFVDLRLESATGERLSSNFYWLPRTPDVLDYDAASWLHCPTRTHADLSALRDLPETTVELSATRGGDVTIELANPTATVAFFVQLRLVDAAGADVLPVVWTDNYVSLFPGDSRTITARTLTPLPETVHVEARGLNVASVWLTPARATASPGRAGLPASREAGALALSSSRG
jgi:exo-1,4-beta-D-glucosaminidase